MKITLLLADAVQEVDGKLYVLGVGWTAMIFLILLMGIGIIIEVPWDRVNEAHAWLLCLLIADGVQVHADDGCYSFVRVEGKLEVGYSLGIPQGSPLAASIAMTIVVGIPLIEGRYEWRFEIAGDSVHVLFMVIRDVR